MTRPEVTGTRKVSFPIAGRYVQDIARADDGIHFWNVFANVVAEPLHQTSSHY